MPSSLSFDAITSLMRNMMRVGSLVRKATPMYFYGGSLLTMLTTIIPFVTAWLSALFINLLVHGGFTSIYDPRLIWIVIGYIALPLINSQLSTTYTHLFNQFYVSFGQYRDNIILEKRASVDIQTYESNEFNNLATRVNENTQRFVNFAQGMMNIFSVTVGAVIAISILARYNGLMDLIFVMALIPQLVVQLRFGKRTWGIWSSRSDVRRKYSEYQRPFMMLPGIIELRVFQTKQYFMDAVEGVVSLFNKELQDSERSRFVWLSLVGTLSYGMSAVYIVVLMHDAIAGALAIGTFTFLVGRIGDVRSNVSSFIFSLATLSSDNLFVTDTFAFLDTPRVLKDGTKKIAHATPAIVFDDVSFTYPGGNAPVLKNVSLSIPAGKKVAIVGVNGAGKTTLTKLLMRFYDPTSGTISVDGMPLNQATLSSWYAHIAYLPQDYAKYRLPVRDAIAIGDTSQPMDDARVKEAARRAGADEFISAWPQGYDTQLGREFDGKEPSVGQWQKLALARVFYKDPSIFILDEPTSSIDAIAELEIFNEFEKLPDDKTVILISHRFNTVKNADLIIVLENGVIAEQGSHDELMHHKGVYHNLFTSQKDSYTH